ncbi:MAG TPA: tRNA (guanosine(37)-N1)-methyltransferase TrmD [Planctomycetota bacterium]|nr:tRNA (guanosine(37)-N1)-methyltransferase TrmD [Planctomycetota bacterium]
MRIDVLTLFPGIFRGFLDESILRLARERGIVEVHLWDIRDHTDDKHRKVDDRPYGGGPGMVMMPGPVFAAAEAADAAARPPARKILLSPQGRTYGQSLARELAREARLMLVCGRYEGFDERIHEDLGADELSVGDYILAGGEVAAMAVLDSVVRLLPGALGDPESAALESFEDGALDYPQYTRPPVFRGRAVPDVLLSGNHEAIRRWRAERARERTLARRPDLAAASAGPAHD